MGIDIGSTTTKIVAIDAASKEIFFSKYTRHHARQLESVIALVKELVNECEQAQFRFVFCGSGGLSIATMLDLPYVQEVVATSIAVQNGREKVKTVIELGGQDAKIIFLTRDSQGSYRVSDMRMNGACAGGTGAFIDEIASLLDTPIESFNELAAEGSNIYEISGRCGVFAKTDIQPLLNQGASKADIALSSFHAIAKQTIGGLAQGLEVEGPVLFAGGPLTFNPRLMQVFSERLELSSENAILPDSAETLVAYGASLSLESLFGTEKGYADPDEVIKALEDRMAKGSGQTQSAELFFSDDEERRAFDERHCVGVKELVHTTPISPGMLKVYVGIDSGSTTTKFVLIDEEEKLVESFYASNKGEPLDVAVKALREIRDSYEKKGIHLEILGVGTTGYGEMLFKQAFAADYHVVETVAHTHAAQKYAPDVSFLLDIGGQDMKAIWVEDGVITDIVVNEACSSGCGSFLENFSSSLGFEVDEIAEAAFSSQKPASLGSRCTVFMNSSIVTEQKNGKTPEDIMAGLCRSIIENVFTKVVRVPNKDSLGSKIVVQGGTFKNDAVLRAFEQYLGKEVYRSPYPDTMGALGVALLTKEHKEKGEYTASSFIGLDVLDSFSYSQQSGVACPFCSNHCSRSIISFSGGGAWVTGNRCQKGEVVGDPSDKKTKESVREASRALSSVPNMFEVRERMLFYDYPFEQIADDSNITIGLPRVLSFWETMPFWKTFFKALGFNVVVSDNSSQSLYESGLSAITSDTVCFPAKLVHGHIRNLVDKKVDRIFMPAITVVESENREKTSESMCAVVKGYPLVIKNSDDPFERWGMPFDNPLFHWYSSTDRERQIASFMKETFGISSELVCAAIKQGDAAQGRFKQELQDEGAKVIKQVKSDDGYAVVLAGRPYHGDTLVNHDIAEIFTQLGIPVLCADALPDLNEVDLSKSRLDITNNYHARILSSGIISAQSKNLELVQIVSFGCGHDAVLSDETIRLMKEISHKSPLILKVDESSAQGALRIRIRSFIEAINIKRARRECVQIQELKDPYPVKYEKKDRRERVVLVPNTSHAFSRLMTAAFHKQGIRVESLELGRDEAIRLGKKYVHNDICFPAQIVIGEALEALTSGKHDPNSTAIGMAKYVGCCRLTHYSALLRKALDDAGFSQVPIMTNDDIDSHDMHPGFKMSLLSALRLAMVFPMIDVLEELLRKIRPYECEKGSTDAAFEQALDQVIYGVETQGVRGAKKGFKKAISLLSRVPYDRSKPRPQVLIVGEYLLNFHPGANNEIERYLEDNGFEVIEARMTDVIRKTYFYKDSQIKEYQVNKTTKEKLWYSLANRLFEFGHEVTDSIAVSHPLYEPATRMPELVKASDSIIHHTFDAGEGVLIPGEILHHAERGCSSFIILQPFGCLPNHVVGRGITKRLKQEYQDIQILTLDYDPDVSFANIENRFQMLITSVFSNQQKDVSAKQFKDESNGRGGLSDQVPERPVDGRREKGPSIAAMGECQAMKR